MTFSNIFSKIYTIFSKLLYFAQRTKISFVYFDFFRHKPKTNLELLLFHLIQY